MKKIKSISVYSFGFTSILLSFSTFSSIITTSLISKTNAIKVKDETVIYVALRDIVNASSGFEQIENIHIPVTYNTDTKECSLQYVDIFPSNTIYNLSFKENLTIHGEEYTISEIESNFFSNMNLSGKLTISNGIKIIDCNAFSNNYVNTLILGNNVEIIENNAFENCPIVSLNIPSKVKQIGSNAFSNNNNQDISITFNWTTQNQFDNLNIDSSWINTQHIKNINVPYGTEDLYKNNLTKLNLDPSVIITESTYVSVNANDLIANAKGTIYYGMHDDEISIVSSENVVCTNPSFYSSLALANDLYPITNISAKAFQSSTNLFGNLTIPNNIKSIGSLAFDSCQGIRSLTMTWNKEEISIILKSSILSQDWLGSLNNGNVFITIPGDLIDTYYENQIELGVNSCVWGVENALIANIMDSAIGSCYLYDKLGSTEIVSASFTKPIKNPSIKSAIVIGSISSPITSILEGAFANQDNLIGSFTIESNITSIATKAFDGCDNITSFNLNWSIDQLNEWFANETNNSNISSDWLGSLNKSSITINVPKGSLSTYKQYATQLGIDKCNITDEVIIKNNNLALGLGLGLGIPILAVATLTPIVIHTKTYEKIKKLIKEGLSKKKK